ncbi:MAG TPA: NFACT family protein, partial [Clostridia bacterium]|nr:NFACT family protein [Clostridia bacterium]
VNPEGVIIDALRRITGEMSQVREILPGVKYSLPPAQNKADITLLSAEEIYNILQCAGNGHLFKLIFNAFTGISSITAREIAHRAAGDADKFINPEDCKEAASAIYEFAALIKAGSFSPHMLYNDDTPADVFPLKYISAHGRQVCFDSFSAMLDSFYTVREKIRIKDEAARDIKNILKTIIDRSHRKLSAQNESFRDCADAQNYKIYADGIMTEIYKLKKGMREAVITDYSTGEPHEMKVELDPGKTPADNAQRYYKKYAKLKRSKEKIEQQIAGTLEELEYLEGQLANIENCTELGELEEIRNELARFGYIAKQRKARRPDEPSRPLHFISRDGIDIYVGKNNLQNDALTSSAAPTDTWLHAKDIHGSHVIIRKKGDIPPETLYDAAMLAAYYSKGKSSANVPIDYTLKKYVKKPSGAKPGKVIYTNNKTLYVTPDAEHIRKLRIEE